MEEIKGKPLPMLRPTRTFLLTMRPLRLASRWSEFCRAALTTEVIILDLLVVYLWRPDLGGSVQSRRPAFPLSPILFHVGLPHSAGLLEGEEPLEERCELRIFSLI